MFSVAPLARRTRNIACTYGDARFGGHPPAPSPQRGEGWDEGRDVLRRLNWGLPGTSSLNVFGKTNPILAGRRHVPKCPAMSQDVPPCPVSRDLKKRTQWALHKNGPR